MSSGSRTTTSALQISACRIGRLVSPLPLSVPSTIVCAKYTGRPPSEIRR
jgi:hypothetical protein